jgi:cation transport regulator
MPYPTNADPPSSVRSHPPEHAQDINSEAFSRLRDSCGRATAGGSGALHRIAWAAHKRSYVKVGNSWIAQAS